MRIAFYAPFKPMDHPVPSGDRTIARGLADFLIYRGHRLVPVSRLRTRWFYWRIWRWPLLLKEFRRVLRNLERERPDCWLTYHSYYKGPDLLGPFVCRRLRLPYVIFQGIYATKYRRRVRTWPGFILNRRALLAADHVFTNKQRDYSNLKRLLPESRLTFVAPGIQPQKFCFNEKARRTLRKQWGLGNQPVVLSAAMFRPDVKTQGLKVVIRACGRLAKRIVGLQLVIAGDGPRRQELVDWAATHMPGAVRFTGHIERDQMYRFFSAGDLFAFPGINESLGMVFLEAQSCHLPVVAYNTQGVPEAVQNGRTGILVPPHDTDRFTSALQELLVDKAKRSKMGAAAQRHVRQMHDINRNYDQMASKLIQIAITS